MSNVQTVKWSSIKAPTSRFTPFIDKAKAMEEGDAVVVGENITGSTQTIMNAIRRIGLSHKFSVRNVRGITYIVHKGAQ